MDAAGACSCPRDTDGRFAGGGSLYSWKKKWFNFQSTQASNYEALKSLRVSHSTYVVMVSCGF